MPIRLTGMISGMDTDAMVKELVSAYQTKTDNYKKKQTTLEWKQDAWKELNSKIYKFYTNTFNKTLSSFYNTKKTTCSDESKASIVAANGAVIGSQRLQVTSLAESAYLTGNKTIESYTDTDGTEIDITTSTKLDKLGISGSTKIAVDINGNTEEIDIDDTMTISDVVKKFKGLGLEASYDEKNHRFYISSKTTGKAVDFDIKTTTDSGSQAALDALGLNYTISAANDGTQTAQPNQAYKINSKSASIVLNGITYESDSNSFSINGLTITAKGLTAANETLTITTDRDVDAIYDSIKGFIKEYNDLIKEMDTLYNAKSSKGYDPLTDDEKESMSDKEVEKWEATIKDSLLRRDNTLNGVISTMKNAMMKTFSINGKNYSLSTFGIKTASYFEAEENEKSIFHIDGDESDSSATASASTDKLKTAIASDPDGVASFFSQLAKGLYDDLKGKMEKTKLSSSYTVYNDIQLQNEHNEYTKTIKKWEDYVAAQEEKWYNKFTAMEKALAQLQSSQSALAGLLGSSN